MKDYHIHSGLLDHTDGDLNQIIKTAEDFNFEEIAITEHFVFPYAKFPRNINEEHDTLFLEKDSIPKDGRKTVDLFEYFRLIEESGRESSVKILKGLEIDYFQEYEDEIRKTLSNHKIDIKLGSCHYLKSGSGENMKYLHVGRPEEVRIFIDTYGTDKLYNDYFENISNSVKSRIFDYIAHIDFLKRGFADYDSTIVQMRITQVLKEMIDYGIGLEINLSGIKDVGETYPSRNIIEEYRKLGGRKISIGSDSHSISRMKKMAPIINDFMKFL